MHTNIHDACVLRPVVMPIFPHCGHSLDLLIKACCCCLVPARPELGSRRKELSASKSHRICIPASKDSNDSQTTRERLANRPLIIGKNELTAETGARIALQEEKLYNQPKQKLLARQQRSNGARDKNQNKLVRLCGEGVWNLFIMYSGVQFNRDANQGFSL